jgi:GntR family transcriptional repressor for pyruvate dehydrogenase complex
MYLVRTQKRIFEDILEYFKGLVRKGKLKPGDRLLSERELALELGVSRASLREALRALEMLGFLSINPGKGTYVLSPNTHSLSAFTELTMYLRPTLFENILEVRVIIECEAVRLTAKRASQEELAYIRSALERMIMIPKGVGLAERASEADFEFHKGIIRATHNDFLIFLYDIIEVLLRRSHAERWAASLASIPDAFNVITRIHRGIYEAIEEGNEHVAGKWLGEHFSLLDNKKFFKNI